MPRSATTQRSTSPRARARTPAPALQRDPAGRRRRRGSATPQRDQEAHTGQQVGAQADSSANGPKNESQGVRVGQAGAGDGGGVGQANTSTADAGASAAQGTAQTATPGSGTAQATGSQSASADADAKADKPENSIVNARIEAPGNDARFEQTNRAGARAEAEDERSTEDGADERTGEDIAQAARANARAELERPANSAVELRLYSDGDTAGGIQSIAASADAAAAADGPRAEATADATLTDPTNTFVSLRVNSAGTTDAVVQDTLAEEIESVNGTTVSRVEEDAADLLWTSTDPTSGLELAFAADGANTDLRIALDDPSLAQPSDGTLFIWTWDMVFGPGGELACAIASSAQNGQIAWNFDCDPDDRIDRASASRPDARGGHDHVDVELAPARPAGLVLAAQRPDSDRDLQRRLHVRARFPLDLVRAGRSRGGGPRRGRARDSGNDPAGDPAGERGGRGRAGERDQRRRPDRVADARGDEHRGADRAAAAARRAGCERARGRDSQRRSQYEHRHRGRRTQVNRAAADAEAKVASTVVQQIAQHAAGEDSLQAQAALQLTTTTQVLSSVGIATIVKSVNSGLSVDGTSTQTTSSLASAVGAETSTARQTVEQEQEGSSSEQDQVAGQWVEVTQALELVATARLVDALNESRLREESSSLRLTVEAESDGSARSSINQLSLQLQAGDTGLQQQESLQLAVVEQSGTALATATGGAFRQLYFTPPPVPALLSAPPAAEVADPLAAPVAAAAPFEATAPAEVAETLAPISSPVAATIAAAVRAKRPALTISLPKQSAALKAPEARPTTDVPLVDRARRVLELPSALAVPLLTKAWASPAGTAGSVSRMTEDAEEAAAGSSGPPCLAPISGAAAATGGTGTGSALVAPSGYAAIPVPRLGRRQFEPAGRRPAAVALLRARPG